MTYIITAACIDVRDRSCIQVCPVDCIYELERMVLINPDECIDCGACEPECPVDAIFADHDLPDGQQPFIEINNVLTTDPASANTLIDEYARTHDIQNTGP